MPLVSHQHFVYHQIVPVTARSRTATSSTGIPACAAASTAPPTFTKKSPQPAPPSSSTKVAAPRTFTTADEHVSAIAAAIGEPARARILYSLMDNRARSSTELAAIAGVTPSTASVHLDRLKQRHLVDVAIQGKHRYYRLASADVAAALEALSVLVGHIRQPFVPTTPTHLRAARTCYDHLAGTLAVQLHDRLTQSLGWLAPGSVSSAVVVAELYPEPGGSAARGFSPAYDVTSQGDAALTALGLDIETLRHQRRRFAGPCLDWSERRPHLGGAIGAALLQLALNKKWLVRDLDSRAVSLTTHGRREFHSRFGLDTRHL